MKRVLCGITDCAEGKESNASSEGISAFDIRCNARN